MTPQEIIVFRDGAVELGVELADAQLDSFSCFVDEMLRWNSRINLTALKSAADIITKHLLDSLTVAPLLPPGASLVDIGSGGGFPAIPLKIARPDLKVVSVDAVQKKINFQRHIVRQLKLDNFIALHSRAEELAADTKYRFDFAVARAVADLPLLVRLCTPLLAEGGQLIAMKGGLGRSEIDSSETVLAGMGVMVSEIVELRLPVSGDERIIILLKRKSS